MKKVYLQIAYLMFAVLQANAQCIPTVGSGGATGDYINNFTFGSLSKLGSGDHPCDYSLDTATGTFLQGLPYNLSIQTGSPTLSQYVAMWIDLNHDLVFDPSEFAFTSIMSYTSVSTIVGTVVIPSTALTGPTRVRLCSKRNLAVSSSESCGISTYGEYEDYVIMIGTASPCTGAPNAGNTQISCCSSLVDVTVTASLQGNSTNSGLAYQWQTAVSSVSPWINQPGANYPIYTKNLTLPTTTCFRCIVTCTTSGSSDTSTVACLPCSLTTSMNTVSSQISSVDIFPNPCIDYLTIKLNSFNTMKADIDIFDISGRIVRQYKMNVRQGSNTEQFDLTKLPNGSYIIRMNTIDGLNYSKLITK